LAIGVTAPVHAAPDPHDHAGHATPMAGMDGKAEAVADTPGTTSAPAVPQDHAADAFFPPDRMAIARDALRSEDRFTYTQVLIERMELQSGSGTIGYAWQGEGSFGADRDRFVLSTEGEGQSGKGLDRGEVQAKWRHAIDPWFNAEAGLRQDFRTPGRTYLLVGIEGLAPYWIDTEAQLFISNKGDVHARLQAGLDQRITQRLVLRPAAEIDVAFQDVPELGITSRVPEWSIGARLRYEIQPSFAPYIGVERRRDTASPADVARGRLRGDTGTNLLLGLSAWF
jgi:copper resistance protein B